MFVVNEFFDERHFVNHYPWKERKGLLLFLPIKLTKILGARGKSLDKK